MLAHGISDFTTHYYTPSFVYNTFLHGLCKFPEFESEARTLFFSMVNQSIFPHESNFRFVLTFYCIQNDFEMIDKILDVIMFESRKMHADMILDVMMMFKMDEKIDLIISQITERKIWHPKYVTMLIRWYEQNGDRKRLRSLLNSVPLGNLVDETGLLTTMVVRVCVSIKHWKIFEPIWRDFVKKPFSTFPQIYSYFLNGFIRKRRRIQFIEVIKHMNSRNIALSPVVYPPLLRGLYYFNCMREAEQIVRKMRRLDIPISPSLQVTRFLTTMKVKKDGRRRLFNSIHEIESDLVKHPQTHGMYIRVTMQYLIRWNKWSKLAKFFAKLKKYGVLASHVEYVNEAMIYIVSVCNEHVATRFKDVLVKHKIFDPTTFSTFVHGMMMEHRTSLLHETTLQYLKLADYIPKDILGMIFGYYSHRGKFDKIEEIFVILTKDLTSPTTNTWYRWKILMPVLLEYALMEQIIAMFTQIHNLRGKVPPEWIQQSITKCEDVFQEDFIPRLEIFRTIEKLSDE
jgi:hypothetical protein